MNLHAAPLAEPSRVKVYSSPEVASGSQSLWPGRTPASRLPLRFTVGTRLIWDTRLWKVINVGSTSISLLSEDQKLAELPMTAFEDLAHQKRIELAPEDLKKSLRIEASSNDCPEPVKEDLRTANYRSGLVMGYVHEAISSDDYRRASSHLLPLGWPVSASRSKLWKWVSGLIAATTVRKATALPSCPRHRTARNDGSIRAGL